MLYTFAYYRNNKNKNAYQILLQPTRSNGEVSIVVYKQAGDQTGKAFWRFPFDFAQDFTQLSIEETNKLIEDLEFARSDNSP